MLKYINTRVTFSEIPDQITLCINISNCPCHCEGCHSAYLADDIGNELTSSTLVKLIFDNEGITAVSFMGGDAEPFYINTLARVVKSMFDTIKVCWYSGRQELSRDIDLKNFDFIKLGPYIREYGPLNCKTTNQIFYEIEHLDNGEKLHDITYKFQQHETENQNKKTE